MRETKFKIRFHFLSQDRRRLSPSLGGKSPTTQSFLRPISGHRPLHSLRPPSIVIYLVLALIIITIIFGLGRDRHTADSDTGMLSRTRSRLSASTPFSYLPLNVPVLPDSLSSIRDLHALIASAERSTRWLQVANIFNKVFTITKRNAVTVIPPAFLKSAKALFSAYPSTVPNDVSFLENQSVFVTFNKFTVEESMFNEVRRYRPGYAERVSPENEAKLSEMNVANIGPETCDFCSIARTATDSFGRIESSHCYAASNVAKYAQWHGLIIAKAHSPLVFDAAAVRDYVATAHKWFSQVHKLDKQARFPHIMWDATRKASASQVHQHLQLVLTHDRYLSRTEQMRRAAFQFQQEQGGRNFWEHFVQIHEVIGLTARVGKSIIISHVCPIKEREIIVVCDDPHDSSFGQAIAVALDAMKEMGMRSFSAAIVFPELDNDGRSIPRWLPSIARIVDRGSPLDLRSDVGAQEFYGSNNVGADPFQIVPALKKRVGGL